MVLIYNFQGPRKQTNFFWFISQTLMRVTRFLFILLWGGQLGYQTCSLFIYLWIIWRNHQLRLHSVMWLDSSWIMNRKAREKKRSWPSFEVLSRHLLGKNEVTDTRDPIHNRRCFSRDSNPVLPEYESEASSYEPTRSVSNLPTLRSEYGI